MTKFMKKEQKLSKNSLISFMPICLRVYRVNQEELLTFATGGHVQIMSVLRGGGGRCHLISNGREVV